jgi:hypothetical protein
VGRLDGTVLSEGKTRAGAMVLLVPQDPGHNLSLARRDQSDSDGTFSLRNVLPGRYTILALKNGWDREWLNADVLEPYLKRGAVLDVTSGTNPPVKVNLQ